MMLWHAVLANSYQHCKQYPVITLFGSFFFLRIACICVLSFSVYKIEHYMLMKLLRFEQWLRAVHNNLEACSQSRMLLPEGVSAEIRLNYGA